MVEALDSDQISTLDLRDKNDSSKHYKIDYFNDNTKLTSDISDFTTGSRIDRPGGDNDKDETYCECTVPVASGHEDCVLLKWNGIQYCDGNFCSSCSLVVVLSNGKSSTKTLRTSVVFLPSTFQ